MTFANKFNRGRKFNMDTTGFEYKSLEGLYKERGKDAVYPLTAIYINTKGLYGEAPVFATTDCFVNAPAHLMEVTREILADDDAVDAINSGVVGFKIYSYVNEHYKKVCYGINFVDIK